MTTAPGLSTQEKCKKVITTLAPGLSMQERIKKVIYDISVRVFVRWKEYFPSIKISWGVFIIFIWR